MSKFDKMINKCQRCGIPDRGRDDDINRIVSNLCWWMSTNNEETVNELIDTYKSFSYISDIKIDRNRCIIQYDEGTINFSTIPRSIYECYGVEDLYMTKLSGNCHKVTEQVLKSGKENVSAVTSLCINTNDMFYFHSYVHQTYVNDIDIVIDFARNLMMDKDDYDRFFCFYEINNLDYDEYEEKSYEFDYNAKKDNTNLLLYLACRELLKNHVDVNELASERVSMRR